MGSDDTKRRRGRRSDIPWADIRAAFEAGETSVLALSRRFKVSRGPIIAHRDHENWTVSEHARELIKEQARSNVIDMATRQAIDHLGGPEAIAEQGRAIVAELLAQRPLFGKAAELLNRTFDRALRLGKVDEKTGTPLPGQLILGVAQGETTAVTDLLGALSKFVRDTRLANGLRDGTPTENSSEDDEKRVDQAVLVVRQRESA